MVGILSGKLEHTATDRAVHRAPSRLIAAGGVSAIIAAAVAIMGINAQKSSEGARITAAPGAQADAPKLDLAAPRINVVLFVIDTLRADRIGAYGYRRRPTTPNIDALAREAVVFEQACAPAPWTLPSVISIVTSVFPCEHRILDNDQKLGDEFEPLAARMKRRGYTTRGTYANALVGPAYGLDRGFDSYKPMEGNRAGSLRRLLEDKPNAPLFLYIHCIEPHTPYVHAPPRLEGFREVPPTIRQEIRTRYLAYRNATRVDFTAKRPIGTTDNTEEQQRLLAALNEIKDDYNELYDAAIVVSDRLVGVLIEELKTRKLWDETLLIVTSDHGEEMDEHGGWLHDQSAYEELMHVPLVIRFPQSEHAGRRVKRPVSLTALPATIFDYLDSPRAASGVRGDSLLPLISGGVVEDDGDFVITGMRWNTKKYYRPWKESRGDLNIVIRQGKWKGIWNVEPESLELYDLKNDPSESHDVSGAHTEPARRMREYAERWLNACRQSGIDTPRPTAEPDADTLENLRQLGYVD